MIVTDQKISETTPKMLSCDTLTGCGSLGLKTVCTVYNGLVPMSPKTTPSAPTASAPCAVARRLTLKVFAFRTRQLVRATLTNEPAKYTVQPRQPDTAAAPRLLRCYIGQPTARHARAAPQAMRPPGLEPSPTPAEAGWRGANGG
jgi:hypothetical protein